jgi:hypothetical protein
VFRVAAWWCSVLFSHQNSNINPSLCLKRLRFCDILLIEFCVHPPASADMNRVNEVSSPFVEMSGHTAAKSTDNDDGYDAERATVHAQVQQVFFDTIGVQFHFDTFLYQFLAHIFLPLFPCMVNMDGQVANHLFTWITPALFYVMIVSYAMSNGQHTPGMEGALLIPMVYYLQHRLVIAMKYGSLSKTEYKKFMNCKDKERVLGYRSQMQLGEGWMNYNNDVIHFELAAASARIGARINDITICIANPDSCNGALSQLRAWNAFLRGHDVIDYTSVPCKQLRRMPDGNYRLSVYDLCEGLVQKASKHGDERNVYVFWTINVFNTANLLIPLILICYQFDFSYSPLKIFWLVTFYLSSTVMNYVYARTFYGLLYIAIVDVYRQLSTMSDLNCMMRLTDIMVYSELSMMRRMPDVELSRVEQRVAEIISIKGSNEAYLPIHYEDPDEDQPDVFALPVARPVEGGDLEKGAGQADLATHKASQYEQSTNGASSATATRQARAPTGSCVLGERIYRDNEPHWMPRINFDESHNVVAWTHARLTMQNFGERFHFRLELYVIAAIAMVAVMMIMGLLQLGLSHHRLQSLKMPWFLQTLLSVTMCIAFLIAIMQTGANVNANMEKHSQTMCSHALRLNRKIEHLRVALLTETRPAVREEMENKIEKLNTVADKLEAMRSVIDTNTELKPFKIFGFTAESSLTMTITTTAVSFYVALLTLLSSSEGRFLAILSGDV